MYFVHLGLDQPADYTIRLQGRMTGGGCGKGVSDWFQGEPHIVFETTPGGDTVTVLSGTVVDQTALHGLLAHVRDMGLILLQVDCLTARGARA